MSISHTDKGLLATVGIVVLYLHICFGHKSVAVRQTTDAEAIEGDG